MTGTERDARCVAVHATALAIAGRGIVLVGASRSGKSTLAAALIARSTRRCRIVLVGDDRVLLERRGASLEARPHPRIAGFLERRGLGIVAVPWRQTATLAGIATLDDGVAPSWRGNLPVLPLVTTGEPDRCDAVLAWWSTMARARHARETFTSTKASLSEDWNW